MIAVAAAWVLSPEVVIVGGIMGILVYRRLRSFNQRLKELNASLEAQRDTNRFIVGEVLPQLMQQQETLDEVLTVMNRKPGRPKSIPKKAEDDPGAPVSVEDLQAMRDDLVELAAELQPQPAPSPAAKAAASRGGRLRRRSG